MARLGIAPPWITYVSELEQLFKYDPEVHPVYNNDNYSVRLYVENGPKASALEQILPTEVEFGNVTLTISVIPSNTNTTYGTCDLSTNEKVYFTAFDGNGAFSFIKTVSGIFANNLTYVVFKNKVVQFFNDDLGDIYGNCSTLYEIIAKNVLRDEEGVFFCTDVEEPVYDLGLPLGEWP